MVANTYCLGRLLGDIQNNSIFELSPAPDQGADARGTCEAPTPPSGPAGGVIPAVRLPLDGQPAHAGATPNLHSVALEHLLTSQSLRASPTSTCMRVLPSCCAGGRRVGEKDSQELLLFLQNLPTHCAVGDTPT